MVEEPNREPEQRYLPGAIHYGAPPVKAAQAQSGNKDGNQRGGQGSAAGTARFKAGGQHGLPKAATRVHRDMVPKRQP